MPRFRHPWFDLGLLCVVAAALFATNAPAQDFSHPDTEPAPQNALIQKANDALAAGDIRGALTLLAQLNIELPNNPQVLYNLGMTLEALEARQPGASTPSTPAQGPSLNAESCYRKAIESKLSFAPPHVALGLLLARTNRAADARAQLAFAVGLPDIEPTLKAGAYRALARLDLSGSPAPGNPYAASGDLLEALKISPEQPQDILLSAEIAGAAGERPAAEKAYRRYLATLEGSGDVQSVSALAHILLDLHRPSEAEALLTPALAQYPNNPAFTAQLAQALLASDDPAKRLLAGPMLVKLHATYPDERAVTRLLARLYLESGHPDQAESLYATLIAGSPAPADPTLLDARAEALLHLHRPAEAEKLLKQAIADPKAFPSPGAYVDALTRLAFAASEIDDPRSTLQALALRATVQQPSPASLFLEATANDALHQSTRAVERYQKFLAAANGSLPEQELLARKRISELQHMK